MRRRPRCPLLLPLVIGVLLMSGSGLARSAHAATGEPKRQALQHYEAGQELLSSERFEDAAEEFGKAVAIDPLLVLAHYGLGQARMALKEYPAAVRAYLNCRKAFQAEEASRLLDRTERESRLNAQIRALEDQVAIQSSGPRQTIRRPLNAANVTNLQRQIASLEALRQHAPSQVEATPPWISVALGGAYFRNGAFTDAEREYREALAVNPALGEAHNNLAVVYMLTGRLEEAESEVALAEKAGFGVSPGFKRDLKSRMEERH